MKITKGNLPGSAGALYMHYGIERRQGNAHVGRMRGDALVTHTENGMKAVVTVDSAAAAAGCSFIAGHSRIEKIRATRSLHKIPRSGGHIAYLWGCTGEYGF